MKGRTMLPPAFFVLLTLFATPVLAQPTWTLDPFGKEKKPEQYEEKKLGSERTSEKKFTTFRRIIQNNVTHYNFYFNANNKINTVVERAKLAQKDDFSQMLSFYPYSLENTASQATDLDSVIYKATGGILLHDLRNDWIDNLYLLIGKAYYFRREFDSAALTFQFINYNLFPRKKGEDDNRNVGSNVEEGKSALSIADKEKRNLVQKTLTQPPSRNDALIWLTRTFIEQEKFGDAAGMISILQGDPNLPKRLRNDLDEVTSYWFFKQKNYDSAAVYLERGISNADNKADKSRWQYLLGQMFERNGDYAKASDYYAKAAKHTNDPILDIYAHLNDAKMFRNTGNARELDNSISTLLKMAKKDKYEAYRDIIYHSAAQLTLQKPDTGTTVAYLGKSLSYNESNAPFKNKAHLQLGNIAYNQQQYKKAADHYDSLDLTEPAMQPDSAMIAERREALRKIAAQLNIIQREDSLQMIAALPATERDALLKKLAKKYRKEKGSKEEDNGNVSTPFEPKNSKSDAPVDLFESSSSKGEWYFYSSSKKSKGFSEFKAKWGKRENVDNWRRLAARESANNLNQNIDIDAPQNTDPLNANGDDSKATEGALVPFSYDALLADLPLTPEKIDSSNASIAKSMIELAQLFENELQDYQQAINTYEIYLQRFPDNLAGGEVYLGLYHCYLKLGNQQKADYYKNLLNKDFADSRFAKMISNPASLQPDKNNPEVEQKYSGIYNKFIEGDFANAIAEKKQADSIYGNHYWSPQLLYIEAVHYIKEKNDSPAIKVLTDITTLYPKSPLKAKAETMIAVLKRRAEIESYLTNLQVTRAEEDPTFIMADDKPVQAAAPTTVATQPRIVQPIKAAPVAKDSGVSLPPKMLSGGFKWQIGKQHHVIMVLNKVDAVYVNEAKNAFARYNREKYFSKVVINKDAIDAERSLLVFVTFDNEEAAIAYYDKIKKAAPSEVSWLQASKYNFYVISEDNLQMLKSNKDLSAYIQLLNNLYPGKF